MYKNITLCFYVAIATVTSFLDAAQPASARAAAVHIDPAHNEQLLGSADKQYEQKIREWLQNNPLMAGYEDACRQRQFYDYPRKFRMATTVNWYREGMMPASYAHTPNNLRDFKVIINILNKGLSAFHPNYLISPSFPCDTYDSFRGYMLARDMGFIHRYLQDPATTQSSRNRFAARINVGSWLVFWKNEQGKLPEELEQDIEYEFYFFQTKEKKATTGDDEW